MFQTNLDAIASVFRLDMQDIFDKVDADNTYLGQAPRGDKPHLEDDQVRYVCKVQKTWTVTKYLRPLKLDLSGDYEKGTIKRTERALYTYA